MIEMAPENFDASAPTLPGDRFISSGYRAWGRQYLKRPLKDFLQPSTWIQGWPFMILGVKDQVIVYLWSSFACEYYLHFSIVFVSLQDTNQKPATLITFMSSIVLVLEVMAARHRHYLMTQLTMRRCLAEDTKRICTCKIYQSLSWEEAQLPQEEVAANTQHACTWHEHCAVVIWSFHMLLQTDIWSETGVRDALI